VRLSAAAFLLWYNEFSGTLEVMIMVLSSKKRVQVCLPQAQFEELQRMARQRGVTVPALIEQSVAALLDDATTRATQANRTSVAEWNPTRPIEEHPLWGVVGLGRSGLSDVAANHDQYLAEILAKESDTWPQQSS
jgi:hypothetical protein